MARKTDPGAGAVQQIPVRGAGLPGLLADCVEDPLAVLDREGRVQFVSRSFRTLLGSPDAAERARDLVEHVEPVVDLARNRLHTVSPGFESLWERSRRELTDGAEVFFETLHAEDRERIRKLAYESLETGFEEEFRIELPDGRTRWVRHRSVPVRDEAGAAVLTIGITQDINRRQEAEARLRESEERYRQLVEDSPESIVVYAEGKIVYANPAGAELAGVEGPDDLIGRPVTDFLDPSCHEFVETHLRRVSRGEAHSGPGEVRHVMGSGSRVTYDGRPAVQAIARDITDWIRGERQPELPVRFRRAGRRLARAAGHRRSQPDGSVASDRCRARLRSTSPAVSCRNAARISVSTGS